MLASGFEGAPLTQCLVIGLLLLSLAASTTNTIHLLPLAPTLHILQERQFWRLLTWQTACSSATDLISSIIVLYQLRVVERLWGTKKLMRFLLSILPYTAILPPLTMLGASRLRFWSSFTTQSSTRPSFAYLPSGPSAVIFALLAQYHAAVPHDYRYILVSPFASRETAAQRLREEREALAREREHRTNAGQLPNDDGPITLTSKSTSYIVPLQLAFSRLPGSLVSALIGWCAGYAWRNGLLWPSWKTDTELAGLLRASNLDISNGSNAGSVTTATGVDKGKGRSEASTSALQSVDDSTRRR